MNNPTPVDLLLNRAAQDDPTIDMWLTETIHDDFRISLRVTEKIISQQSRYQLIELYESVAFGKVLVLDGVIQLAERDEHIYHEMLVHLPLLEHGQAKNVLIIGGGDGCSAYRALMHPNVHVTLVEIDDQVVTVCQQHLGHLNNGLTASERFTLLIDDGFAYLPTVQNKFDLIIIDSSDPVGPSNPLFSADFYQQCARALADDGVLVCQAGMPLLKDAVLPRIRALHSGIFDFSGAYLATVPTYVGGSLAFAWATNNPQFSKTPLDTIRKRVENSGVVTKSYNPEVHRAAFCLPAELLSYSEDFGQP